jgi:hypothetical protein
MSSFNEIANNVPTPALDTSTLLTPQQEHVCICDAPLRIDESILNAKHQHFAAFVKLFRQACLDEACIDALFCISDQEAQVMVDAIQLVSAYVLRSGLV